MKLFKRKSTGYKMDPTEYRWWIIVSLVKDLTDTKYELLKETMDMVHEAYGKCQKIKTPGENIDELGGFLAHEKEGVK